MVIIKETILFCGFETANSALAGQNAVIPANGGGVFRHITKEELE